MGVQAAVSGSSWCAGGGLGGATQCVMTQGGSWGQGDHRRRHWQGTETRRLSPAPSPSVSNWDPLTQPYLDTAGVSSRSAHYLLYSMLES